MVTLTEGTGCCKSPGILEDTNSAERPECGERIGEEIIETTNMLCKTHLNATNLFSSHKRVCNLCHKLLQLRTVLEPETYLALDLRNSASAYLRATHFQPAVKKRLYLPEIR